MSLIVRGFLVRGQVWCLLTHSRMAYFSKQWPYFVITGSIIMVCVMGHKNDSKDSSSFSLMASFSVALYEFSASRCFFSSSCFEPVKKLSCSSYYKVFHYFFKIDYSNTNSYFNLPVLLSGLFAPSLVALVKCYSSFLTPY